MERKQIIESACAQYDNDSFRMMDILWAVQNKIGHIDSESMSLIAQYTQVQKVEIEGVVSFYAFFQASAQGKYVIHLCEDIIDRHAGFAELCKAISDRLGIVPGQTSDDGMFSLHLTPSIGMSDQAPAALINGQVMTNLTPSSLNSLITALQQGEPLPEQVKHYGDGNNAHPILRSMVRNNICHAGQVLLAPYEENFGLQRALSVTPQAVIDEVLASELKGRGGAGYQSASKWQVAADTAASRRYIICNADEGEPGTFKDRVLLTERAEQLIEGMTIAAYAIGASDGIIYLRAEYRYLLAYLELVLAQKRTIGALGDCINLTSETRTSFAFDIRIQLGAGAYICGEESALIRSCEGKRGEPSNKPPYPATQGYKEKPTIVNNVETYCNLPSILSKGSTWFRSIGTPQSRGTKLLSVCGDCLKPGVYEVDMGITLAEVLRMAQATNPEAVQVGGASGVMVGRSDFERRLCFEDLPSAGAIMIFASHRNILEVVNYFMHFFVEESCGYCTPCRVGNVFLKDRLERVINGLGEPSDLDYLRDLSATINQTSRCGLGHTSPNPILSSMKNFPLVYAALLKERSGAEQAGFNIQNALDESRIIAKRRSLIYDPDFTKTPE